MPVPADLLPQIYTELRRLAQAKLEGEHAGHTLNATALVHEAFLKLGGEKSFASRSDYLKAAATAMRRILVDHARAKLTVKRGGGAKRVEFGDVAESIPDAHVLFVNDALDRLAESKPDHAKLIELRYFGGMTGDESAAAMAISAATADRMW